MAEIYTKPFESVKATITLFEQKIDPKKCSSSSNKEEKGGLLKDLSLLVESKEHEKDLPFFEFDASSKSPKELLTLLKLYRAERDIYKEKFRKSQALNVQLELLRRYLDETEDLEKEFLKQMIISEYLHMELKQSKEAQTNFSKTILSAMNELDFLTSEYEQMSSEKINGMNCKIEMLVGEIRRMREKMSKKLVVEVEEAKTESEVLAEYNKAAFLGTNSDGFCTGITISMAEYEFLIMKAELADGAKREPTDESELNKLKRELEDRNAEVSELSCRLEETEKIAEAAEEAKLAVESQLRKWRDRMRLRRTASDAVKEYCAMKNEAIKQQEKPLLSKLACMNPELHGISSHPKRSVSMHDGRKSKLIPLGKLLKIKLESSS